MVSQEGLRKRFRSGDVDTAVVEKGELEAGAVGDDLLGEWREGVWPVIKDVLKLS